MYDDVCINKKKEKHKETKRHKKVSHGIKEDLVRTREEEEEGLEIQDPDITRREEEEEKVGGGYKRMRRERVEQANKTAKREAITNKKSRNHQTHEYSRE